MRFLSALTVAAGAARTEEAHARELVLDVGRHAREERRPLAHEGAAAQLEVRHGRADAQALAAFTRDDLDPAQLGHARDVDDHGARGARRQRRPRLLLDDPVGAAREQHGAEARRAAIGEERAERRQRRRVEELVALKVGEAHAPPLPAAARSSAACFTLSTMRW